MRISYNWLKTYIHAEISVERMAEILTETGLEVEGFEKREAVQGGLNGVVIGEVITCEKHPDADRLKVTTVSVGSDQLLQIVCGAPNVAVGQKVAVATVGCTLYPKPDEKFEIKKSKIRGVESEGMLCAEDELGIGQGHDGILVLDPNAKVGSPASSYFQLEDDYILEIGLTPNRSDAMGHIGVARDLIAYLNVNENKNLSLIWPSIDQFKIDRFDLPVKVSIKDHKACPKYTALTIKGVEVKPSPVWLQKRLMGIGLSPINNVVDVTNFVMHELGNPLHAFDADVVGDKIVVQTAKKDAVFKTLDGVERKMAGTELMITNGKSDLCIAGVFGGAESGINEKTTSVVLESAYFDAVSVRKTAKIHGLSTDSSFRFERGVDPERTIFALKRAATLIKEVAGGEIAMEIFDSNPDLIHDVKIQFSIERCRKLIGFAIPDETIQKILENLGFRIALKNGDTLFLEVPAFRVDVSREADVIEEVLRIYGYNRIPLPEKLNSSLNHFARPDEEKMKQVIADTLVGMGFFETLNNSLTKAKYVEDLGGEVLRTAHNVSILNPLSQDLSVMRQSLIFNALEVVEHNQNRQHPDLRIFEFGKVYHQYTDQYAENQRLLLLVTGTKDQENWNSQNGSVSFYTLKSYVMNVLDRLGLRSMVREVPLKKSLFSDGIQLMVNKTRIGELGWIDKKTLKYFGVKNPVFIADLDWDAILSTIEQRDIRYTELPKTFAVRRDFSLLLNKETNFAELEALAFSVDSKLLKKVGLFDVYEGDKVPQGKKSYALSFYFQDNELTLKDEQIDAIMERLRGQFETKLDVQLRT